MKKNLIKILCAVLSAVFALGMLSGCELLVSDRKRDMEQVVAEVNVGNDAEALKETFAVLEETLSEETLAKVGDVLSTDEIYKRDLVAYFMSYGYSYLQQGMSVADAVAKVMNDLVEKKILTQFTTLYYLNAGEVLVDRDAVDEQEGYVSVDGTDAIRLDKEISVAGYLAAIDGKQGDEAAVAGYRYFLTQQEVNFATYNIMVSLNQTIDSYEKQLITAEDKDDNKAPAESRPNPTGANVISESHCPMREENGQQVIDYAVYTGSNNVSDCGDYEKVEGSTTFTRKRAYAQFIYSLRQNYLISEDEKDVSDPTKLSYFNVEFKTQLEQLVIRKFYKTMNLKMANILTEDAVKELYEISKLSQEKAINADASAFVSTMDGVSDTSFAVYSPLNRKYGYVYNILLPFGTNQKTVLDQKKNSYTAGTAEYYASRNADMALYGNVVAKDQRTAWFEGQEDFSYEAEGEYFKNAYNGAADKQNYLFFEDSYVTSDKGIDRYAGKYPFNGTVTKEDDGDYKFEYNELKIDDFIAEMESYIKFVSGATATGEYFRGNKDAFFNVTAEDFPKVNGKVDQSANIYYKGSVAGVGEVANKDILVKDTVAYKTMSAVNELMFAYSTDPGCLNKYYGYSVQSKEDKTDYVAEFEFAAQEIIQDGNGVGNYCVVATDFGWHIMYVTFVFDGGEVFEGGYKNEDHLTEGTFSYYFYQAKKKEAVSNYANEKEMQIRTKLHNDTVVKDFKGAYNDLINLA